jgi:hypothetical protein
MGAPVALELVAFDFACAGAYALVEVSTPRASEVAGRIRAKTARTQEKTPAVRCCIYLMVSF